MARLDKYLDKINGGSGDIPAPVSSLDKQMAELAESGGGGAIVLTVNESHEVSETWQTIYDALGKGTRVVFVSQNDSEGYVERTVFDVTFAYGGGGEYGIESGEDIQATCTSADAYPVVQS